ncbi:tRNA/rRNA methyltransferase [Fluviispira multicolorata]|uniref:tRNA/rRNA methyltransferase n=1 Tax=Fluviispira multicolorata TaxID=2654512 RepID=A0A833JDN6_9BACT|nr:tRNA/rRNA methyltransferase [Fluviispira multicolorata]KAB8031874.1 tRNA/rRNA methyltransferase [Fluviispira multicolorata]
MNIKKQDKKHSFKDKKKEYSKDSFKPKAEKKEYSKDSFKPRAEKKEYSKDTFTPKEEKKSYSTNENDTKIEGEFRKKERHGENRQVPKPRRHVEMKICGIHACHMVFKKRAQDIIRAYVTEGQLKEFTKVLKYCADKKLAYRVVTEEELERISESSHHEGVCFLVRKIPTVTLQDYLDEQEKNNQPTCVVALENVLNPHNLGAIMRVCANFGVKAILLSQAEASMSGAAYRTSEGGAEWIKIISTDNFEKAIQSFRKSDFKVMSTTSHTGKSLYDVEIPKKLLVLFGSEGEGLSQSLLKGGDNLVRIPSTGNVESLNVACASSIILAEFWRNNMK